MDNNNFLRCLILPLLLTFVACSGEQTLSSGVPGLTGTAWTEHILVPIGGTGSTTMGADGVHIADVEGVPSVCTPWEQGSAVTVAALDGSTTNPVVGLNPGGEDAKCIDVDGDGHIDAVSSSEGSKKIKIQWGPTWSTSTVIAAATNTNRWMQLAWDDLDNDGHPDLIGGGKNAAPNFTTSTWGYFTTTSPRTATAWTWHPIAAVGWTMALRTLDWDGDGDQDVFLTDRSGQTGNQNPTKGAWWYENTGGQFAAHQIAQIGGDPSFGDAADLDSDGDMDVVAGNRMTLTVYTQTQTNLWSASGNIKPSDTGDVHGILICDVDGDSTLDLLTTYALTAIGDSWVVWLDQSGNAYEVAGAADVQRKPDQPACYDVDGDGDLDAVWAEGGDGVKTDDKGVGWSENPRI